MLTDLNGASADYTRTHLKTIFNPPISEIHKVSGRRLVFVHVGKCAGGSLILSLNAALDSSFTMFEMHCHNANQLIRELVTNGPDDLIFLILSRDPIDRFVSAFNWDKHNMYLSQKTPGSVVAKWYEEFPTVEILARALTDTDSVKAERALKFSRFGHMGMGQSWYAPLDLIDKIPADRTFLCETETFSTDLHNIVWSLDDKQIGNYVRSFHHKGDFTAGYENADHLFDKNLSPEGKRNLRVLLNEDFLALHQLHVMFRRQPSPEHFFRTGR